MADRANKQLPHDKQIRLVVEDGNCDPKETTFQAARLVDAKIHYVIGAPCGSDAAAVLTAAGNLFFVVGEDNTSRLTPSELLFQVRPGAVHLTVVAKALAPRTLGSGKFSITDCDPSPTPQTRLAVKIDDSPQICNPPAAPVSPIPRGPRSPGINESSHQWAIQTYVAMEMLSGAFTNSKSEVQSIVAKYLKSYATPTLWGPRKFSNAGVLSPYKISITVPAKSSFERSLQYDRADADPTKDAGCTKEKCTTTHSCTTDSKGNQTCTDSTSCSYSCS